MDQDEHTQALIVQDMGDLASGRHTKESLLAELLAECGDGPDREKTLRAYVEDTAARVEAERAGTH